MRKTESLDQVCPSGAYVPTWTSKLQNKSEFRGSILEELINFATSVPDFRRSNKGNIPRLLKDKSGMEIICVDGKALRGTVLASGSNPDIVSAYSPSTGITLATEACHEKSNEIKALPRLIDRIDVAGKVITADAMSMQKDIIDKIRKNGGDFLIELKANQRSLRYEIEDRIKTRKPLHSYTEGAELGHGRIETRTYRIHDGLGMIADREKWGGGMTVVEYESDTVFKSTGVRSTEKRLYVTSLAADTPLLGAVVRTHWSIESMHWGLDVNLQQDRIKRRSGRAARNLDTIHTESSTQYSPSGKDCARRGLTEEKEWLRL